MREDDYIIVSDLTILRTMRSVLGQMHPPYPHTLARALEEEIKWREASVGKLLLDSLTEDVKQCVYCGGDCHPAECGQPA